MEPSVQKIQKTTAKMEYIHLKRRLNKVTLKMSSQEGASITYALLLFLVCAVVSSVILAAGTAASGRISKVVENDQRYYAVTSAARLLKEEIEKWQVRVESMVLETGEGTSPIGNPKFKKRTNDQERWTDYSPNQSGAQVSPGETEQTILTTDVAEYYAMRGDKPNYNSPRLLEVGTEVGTYDDLTASVSETVEDNDLVTFQITCPATPTPDDTPYTVTMVFTPIIKRSEIPLKEDSSGNIEKLIITEVSWSMKTMR